IVVALDRFYPEAAIPTKNTVTVETWQYPALALEEVLDYQDSVDIIRRGISGVQADMTIRGSTPEQTKFSINGIAMNDPQTAHHNLDTGIPKGMVEKIQVAKASTATLWGQGAMGGAVNLITRKPDKNEGEAYFSYGTDETREDSLYASYNKDFFGINFSAEEAVSNGWRHDTDFRSVSLASSALLKINKNISSNLLLSYGEKEFGAAYFYGPYNSKEWTDTLLFNWSAEAKIDNFKLIPKLYFRRHHDKFMLDIERPDFYLNHHVTDIEGFQVETKTDLEGWGEVLAGVDINEEDLKSTRLGKGSRNRSSYFLSWHNYENSIFGYDLSAGVDDYSDYETQVSPQAGIFFILHKNIKLRSAIAKATRTPTYTELYYDSPSSKGNKDLSVEKAMNYEAGVDLFLWYRESINTTENRRKSSPKAIFLGEGERSAQLSCTIFRRDSSGLIDWVKDNAGQSFYQARNLTEVKTEGIETELSIKPFEPLKLKAGYVYIDSDIEKGFNYISRYALNNPDHKVTTEADIILPIGTQNFRLIYKDRKGRSHYITAATTLSYEIVKGSSLFINVDNIFNSSYEDIENNTLPGREISAGARVKF
ncbi:MAG: TonB-dependent receptor, partial [Candidatus Omnitrophota bacterium]